jgi:hypothetical protein
VLDSDFIRRKVTKEIAAGADVSRESEAAKFTDISPNDRTNFLIDINKLTKGVPTDISYH